MPFEKRVPYIKVKGMILIITQRIRKGPGESKPIIPLLPLETFLQPEAIP